MQERALSRLDEHFDTTSLQKKRSFVCTFSGFFLGMMVSKPLKNKENSFSDLLCVQTGL